jgi:putative drug exporter of the RND superfamily
MHAAYSALGRFTVRFRWLVLLAWLIAIFGSFAVFPSLESVTKANNSDFLPKSSPSSIAVKLASPLQNSNLTPVPVVVSRTDGTLTAADAAYVQQLVATLAKVPHVKQVRDLGQSPDLVATQIQTLSNINLGQDAPSKTLIDDLREAVRGVPAPPGVQTNVAGQLADQIDVEAKSGNTGQRVQLLSVVFILVLLILIFRSPLAPLVTLGPAFLVTQLAGRIVAQLTHVGLQVSSLSQIMLIILVLGAGTDYGLFLIFRVREEIRSGLAPRDAIVRSVERVGESITFSAGTVIAALLSLLAATFGIYSSLGVPLAIAIATMLLAGLTLLPALLAILGRAVFWPVKLRAEPDHETPLWGRIAGRIVARPALTLAIGLVVFGGLAVAVTGYTPAGFGSSVAAPHGSDARAGDDVLNRHFPKAAANPTNVIFRFGQPVWTTPAKLDQAQRLLAAAPVFNEVTGPTNPNGAPLGAARYQQLHNQLAAVVPLGDPRKLPAVKPAGLAMSQLEYQLYRSLANYISSDGKTVQYLASLAVGDPATTTALHAVPAIRTTVTGVGDTVGAEQSAVAGEAPALYDISATSDRDLRTVIPIAIMIIGVLLAIVMRSLVAPLYLVTSVLLSYLAALGLTAIIFVHLGGQDGINFVLPFLMFVFLMALGSDYNVLVMTRIREESHLLPTGAAVRHAIGATGTTVTTAGLILGGTFAVLAFAGGGASGGSQIQQIGYGVAFGVVMDTFVVRTILVPAIVVLLGRRNWWPSGLWRQGEPAVATTVQPEPTPNEPVAIGSD